MLGDEDCAQFGPSKHLRWKLKLLASARVNTLRSADASLAAVAADLLGTVNKTGAVNNVNRRREDGTWSEGGNGAGKDGTFVRGRPQGRRARPPRSGLAGVSRDPVRQKTVEFQKLPISEQPLNMPTTEREREKGPTWRPTLPPRGPR